MADKEHYALIKQGVAVWNNWRAENPDVRPDLAWADLCEMNLSGIDLFTANLRGARLREADLSEASLAGVDLRKADLTGTSFWRANLQGAFLTKATLTNAYLVGAELIGAVLQQADLCEAKLISADLRRANLRWANLRGADLSDALLAEADLRETDLSNASLEGAQLIRTKLAKANLTSCRVYGISSWDVNLEGTTQLNLVITPDNQPIITVDNLEVAQFIYLILNNEKLRSVIDTITTKVVLILGRFTPERKAFLDAIRNILRLRDYLPVLFDFDPPRTRNMTETITTLARLARFVIADITEPRSVPQELYAIIPHLPSVPIQPLMASSESEYGMFRDFENYPWVLKVKVYRDIEDLPALLSEIIIAAEAKAREQKTSQQYVR